MSVLELIGSILTELEKVQEKLDRLLVMKPMVAVMDSSKDNDTLIIERIDNAHGMVKQVLKTTMKEEVECDKDLSGVVLLKETDKAFLAFKKNMQVWVAKSHLEGEYDLGNTYDLKVKEASKWILKKLDWKPFTVVKN